MISRQKRFPGGYRFARFEGQPAATLDALVVPERVFIPLRQGFRDAARPVVSVGDPVAAGQVVGVDDGAVCSPVHASVAGRIEAIHAPDPATGAGGCVVIAAARASAPVKLPGHASDWRRLPVETIEDLLYASGAAALGDGGIPTRHRSAIILPADVEAVLVRDTGSEMYNPSLSVLLGEGRLQAFAEGLQILQKLFGGKPVHVAMDARETALVDGLSAALGGQAGVRVQPLPPRYPQDFAGVLVPLALGRPFPHGYAAANIGVVMLDIQAVLHVHEAVTEGKPVTERIVALCGPGFRHTGHVRVPVGAALADVARAYGGDAEGVRLVRNSTLTGALLPDPAAPVDRTFSAIVALPERGGAALMPFVRPGLTEDAYSRTFLSCLLPTARKASASLKGERRPCVSCGYCQDVCPTGLIPHLLYKHAARGYLEDNLVDELRIFDCIGCNLCSYVCPSKIGLGRHIRAGQQALLAEGVDNSANVRPCFTLKGLDNDRKAP